MTEAQTADAEESGSPERVITLTDGVVAIAMTLLALDLKPDLESDVSTAKLAGYFGDHIGAYIAFVIAFFVVAQYWLVHHRLMRGVVRQDGALLWSNMLFLFGVTLIPLTSYLDGNFDSPLSTSIFAGSLVLMTISMGLISEVISRHHLRDVETDAATKLRGRVREVVTIVVPVAVGALVWVLPHASYLFFLYSFSDTPGRLLAKRYERRHRVEA